MAHSIIHDWLASRGAFAQGVELIKTYGKPSRADLVLYRMSESPFSREKLVRALKALNDAAIEEVLSASPAPPVTGTSITTPDAGDSIEVKAYRRSLRKPGSDIPEELLPVELRPLRRNIASWFREMMYTKGTIVNLPDGMDLKQAAGHLVGLRRKILNGWRVIEHFRATGALLNQEVPGRVLNPVQLIKRQKAIGVWLSQRKHGHRTATAEAIAAKEKELAEVNELLKQHALSTQ